MGTPTVSDETTEQVTATELTLPSVYVLLTALRFVPGFSTPGVKIFKVQLTPTLSIAAQPEKESMVKHRK
jgi:hypothetical protein